jgi:hypothetical protein
VDCLLFLGDSQRYFLTPRAEFALDKVYGKSDLKPLLARLWSPGSGWRAIFDMDDSWHLFVQPGVNIRSDDFRGLPDYFPGQLLWPDGGVGHKFTAHVKIDPASPILSLKGEMPYYDEKSRTLAVPYGKEVLTTLNLPLIAPSIRRKWTVGGMIGTCRGNCMKSSLWTKPMRLKAAENIPIGSSMTSNPSSS